MIRALLFWLGITLYGAAGIMDTFHLYQAQHYTREKAYSQALIHYRLVSQQNDILFYNIGNVLYHLKRYPEAIASYMQVTGPDLQHDRYHNIANAMIAIGDIRRAITLYQHAFTFKDDPDTRYNLRQAELLQQKMEEEKQHKARKDSNETMVFRKGFEKVDRFKEDNGTDDLKEAPPSEKIYKIDNATYASAPKETGLIDILKKEETNSRIIPGSPELSNSIEAQRWKQILARKKLKTLLIPLEITGETHDKNPF